MESDQMMSGQSKGRQSPELHERLIDTITKSDVKPEAKAVALKAVARHCLNNRDPKSCNMAVLALEKLQSGKAPDDSLLTLRAQSLYLLGRTAEALPLLQQALDEREKRLGPQARDVRDHREALVDYYVRAGKSAAAEQVYIDAVQAADARGNKDEIVRSLWDLSRYYRLQTPPQYAKSEQAQLRRLQLLGDKQGPLSPDTVRARDELATMYLVLGKADAAVDLYTKLVAAAASKDKLDQENALNQLATIYSVTGKYADAQRILAALPEQSDPILEQRRLYNLARLSGFMGKPEQQEAYLKQLSEYCSKQPDELAQIIGYATLGSYYWNNENYAAAAPLIKKEYELSQLLEPDERLIRRIERERMERFCIDAGNYEEAERLLKEDVDPVARPYESTIAVNAILFSRLYEKQKKPNEAEAVLVAAAKRLPPSERPMVLHTLSSLYCTHGKPREAIALLQKEIAAQQSSDRRTPLKFWLAKAYLSAGNPRAARTLAKEVLAALDRPRSKHTDDDDRMLFIPVTASADTENQNLPTPIISGESVAARHSANHCFEVYFIDDKEYDHNGKRIAKVVRPQIVELPTSTQYIYFPHGTEQNHSVDAVRKSIDKLLAECDRQPAKPSH
jgi:Flp pilus assembly protein TadD